MQNAWDVLKEFLPGPINAPGCGWYAKTSLITVMLEEFGDMFDDISISAMLDLRHCRFVFFSMVGVLWIWHVTISVFLCPMFTGVDSKEWCGKPMGLYVITIQKDLGYHFLQIREKHVYYHFQEEKTFGKRSAKPNCFFPKAGDVGYFSGHDSSKPWSRRWDKLKQPGTVQYKTWSYETRDQAIHFCEAILSVLFMTCCSKTDPHIQ